MRLDVGAGPRLNQVTVTGTNYERSVDFYRRLGLKQIVDSPDTGYARFETAGGVTFSVQIDPEEKIIATTAIYLECDDLDERVEQLARSGMPSSMARATSRGCGARRGCATPTATSSSSTRRAKRAASRRGGSRTNPPQKFCRARSLDWPTSQGCTIGLAPCRGAAPSSSSSIIRSRWPASTRRAARRSPGRSSPPPASSTATNSRAGSTTPRTCRSKSARRSTPSWSNASAWGVGIATVEEIDQINIYWARMLAMTRAVEALGLEPAWVLVDGNATPALAAAVEGDRRRRRQVPLDRRRLDHRQGHSRPDDGRLCARLSGLRLGA